ITERGRTYRDRNRDQAGEPTLRHEVVACGAGVPRGKPVIRESTRQLVLHLTEAGKQAADEAGARRRAGRFEAFRLRRVHQHQRRHTTFGRMKRITQWEREFEKATAVLLCEVDPRLDGGTWQGQLRCVLALADTEVVEATGVGKPQGVTAAAQRRIHSVGFQHRRADQRRVPVHMVHRGKKGEVAFVLNDAERETTPLQRTRYVHDTGVYLVDCQVPVSNPHEFDVGRIGKGMPDELSITGLFEPAAKSVVPTQVCVDGVIHGGDVTSAWLCTAGDDLPGEGQIRGRSVTVVTKVLPLHVADRYRTDRRLTRFHGSSGARLPRGN